MKFKNYLFALLAAAGVMVSCEKAQKDGEDSGKDPEPPTEEMTFELKAEEVGETSAKVTVTPSDKEAVYYYNVIKKTEYKNDAAMAQKAIDENAETFTGDQSKVWENLEDDKGYYVYAFQITEKDGVKTPGKVTKIEFRTLKTPEPPLESCKFNFIPGNYIVTLSTELSSQTATYYVGVTSKENFIKNGGDTDPDGACKKLFDNTIAAYQEQNPGMSVEDILKNNDILNIGNLETTLYLTDENTEYCAYLIQMGYDGVPVKTFVSESATTTGHRDDFVLAQEDLVYFDGADTGIEGAENVAVFYAPSFMEKIPEEATNFNHASFSYNEGDENLEPSQYVKAMFSNSSIVSGINNPNQLNASDWDSDAIYVVWLWNDNYEFGVTTKVFKKISKDGASEWNYDLENPEGAHPTANIKDALKKMMPNGKILASEFAKNSYKLR